MLVSFKGNDLQGIYAGKPSFRVRFECSTYGTGPPYDTYEMDRMLTLEKYSDRYRRFEFRKDYISQSEKQTQSCTEYFQRLLPPRARVEASATDDSLRLFYLRKNNLQGVHAMKPSFRLQFQ